MSYIFLIFLRVASTLQQDDLTSFTCSVHLRSSLSQFPNFLYPITVLSFKVRGWVYPSRLCTLDICLVMVIAICLVLSLVSFSSRLLSAAHDSMLLRVSFILSTQRSKSHLGVAWCSTVVSSAKWKLKSHLVSNLGCHSHKSWRERAQELIPVELLIGHLQDWIVCHWLVQTVDG